MKVLIKVTSEILERSMMCGTKWNNVRLAAQGIKIPEVEENCAIALAVREIMIDAKVFPRLIMAPGSESSHIIDLPAEATRFIEQFDRKSEDPRSRLLMQPISFEIDLPNELIEEIGINEVYKVLSESKTLEMVM